MNSFCVIGLGQFGQTVASTLAEAGKQVMIIDSDADKVTALADVVTNAVIGDPTNESVLRASGISDYECAIVCMASNINDNILLTILLKDLGIGRIVVRAINEGHKKVIQRLGADMIVFPEQDMGERLANMLSMNNVTEFIDFSGYQLVQIRVPEAWVEKTLLDLDVRKKYGVNIIAVCDENGENADVSPAPTRTFKKGERISIIAAENDMERLMKKING